MSNKSQASTFDVISSELSVRAMHVLEKCAIKDGEAFLRLTREDMSRTWGCGKGTIAEIEKKQSKLRMQGARKIVQLPRIEDCSESIQSDVFRAIQGELSVRAANAIQSLGISDLKSFMRLNLDQLLDCRNCGRKSACEILKIQGSVAEMIQRFAVKSGDPNIKEFSIDVANPVPWLTNWILGLARSKREANAFMFRKGMLGFAPMTLDSVAQQVGDVTRERVRQMENSIEKRAAARYQQLRLRPLMEEIAVVVELKGGIATSRELVKDVLCKGTDSSQFRFATELIAYFATLQVWKDTGLVLQNGNNVTKGDALPLIENLASIICEVALSEADERRSDDLWSIERERLKGVLQKKAHILNWIPDTSVLSDAIFESVLERCKNRIKTRTKRIYSAGMWQLRFGNIVHMIDTILRDAKKPTHYSVIAEEAAKWRPGFSVRNTYATLSRCETAMLWDVGTYVHRDYVVLPLSLIHDVERWLLNALSEDVPYVSIYGAFVHFHSRCEQALLPSETALYSCLRQSNHRNLVYPRPPSVYLYKNFSERVPVSLALTNFLRDAGGPVTQQELEDFALRRMFLKDHQFALLCQQFTDVMRTSDWGYLHLDNYEYDCESLSPVIEYAQQVLSGEGHCSIEKIYRDKCVTCLTVGIDGPVMLYSAFQCFANDVFTLPCYPQVAKRHAGEDERQRSITTHVVNFVLEAHRPCTYEYLDEHFVQELGYQEQHVYAIYREPDLCMYHSGCVVHFQTLAWNVEKQRALENVAADAYSCSMQSGGVYSRVSHLVESPGLPELPDGLHWSNTMVADMLRKGGQYVVLGNAREAFLPRNNKFHIQSLESLIGNILERDWGGAAKFTEFEDALVKAGIIIKSLTSAMLGSGEIVVIKNAEIMLKELFDAQRT